MANCPDYPSQCRAPGSTQRALTPLEREQLIGRSADFAAEAEVCSYCSLVFTRNPARRLGVLKDRFEPFKWSG